MKKKEPQKCRKCSVELSWKELLHGLCFVCESDEARKEQEFSNRHHGALRSGD
jgi:hypothetical protein